MSMDPRTCLSMAVVVLLSACGFTPLYKQNQTINVPEDFRQIEIARIPDKIGLDLENKLIEKLQSQGQKKPFRYRLQVALSEEKSSLAVKKSAFATRANLTIRAHYQLQSIDDPESVFNAQSRSSVSYDLLTDQYATLAAEKNARTRAVLELSEKIKIQLAAFFQRLKRTQ